MVESISCPLCRAEKKTKWYYADKTCWIADCETCHIPMVVARRHGPITDIERSLMLAVVNRLFEYKLIRMEPRRIKDHIHWHLEGAKYIGA